MLIVADDDVGVEPDSMGIPIGWPKRKQVQFAMCLPQASDCVQENIGDDLLKTLLFECEATLMSSIRLPTSLSSLVKACCFPVDSLLTGSLEMMLFMLIFLGEEESFHGDGSEM